MNMPDEIRTSADDQKRKTSSSVRKSKDVMDALAAQEKQENFQKILKNIYEKEQEHHDSRDISLQPSFSKFQLPYIIKCRNRYNASKKLYEQRFQYEIEQLIAQQATGYEAARLNRHLCITTIWPPLHSRHEIVHTQRYFFSLTPKERQRLNWIMSTKII